MLYLRNCKNHTKSAGMRLQDKWQLNVIYANPDNRKKAKKVCILCLLLSLKVVGAGILIVDEIEMCVKFSTGCPVMLKLVGMIFYVLVCRCK